MKTCVRFVMPLFCVALLCAFLPATSPQAMAQVSVSSTTPSSAEQGTVNLNVTINGKGFKKGAQARWFVSGTTDPGGVSVNSTAFVSSTQLTANITVADTAVIGNFDVQVTSGGRTGKGTELFAVQPKGSSTASCTPVTPIGVSATSCPGPGCVDATFDGGVVVTDINPTSTVGQMGRGIVVQSDGRLIAIGDSSPTAVVRYLPDGRLDASFGSDGVARLDSRIGTLNAVALQPDGKIVLVGHTGQDALVAARLMSDGSFDLSFGTSGVFTFTMPKVRQSFASLVGNAVAIQRDGMIVVSGFRKDARWLVLRLTTNGVLDNTFGSGGQVTIDFGLNDIQYARDMLLQDNVLPGGGVEQRILVIGDVKGSNTSRDWGVARLLPNGQQDPTFGSRGNGTAVLDFCSADESPQTAKLDSSGRIWIAGGTQGSWAIARYTANGTVDTSFGALDPLSGHQTGKMRLQVSSGGISDMAIDSSGRISLLGDYAIYQGATLRLLSDGSVDPSYGNGYVMYPAGFAFIGSDLQADGALVITGWRWSDTKFAVARLIQ